MEDVNLNIRVKQLGTTINPPVTQKAKGVWCLIKQSPFSEFLRPATSTFLLINSDKEKDGVLFGEKSYSGKLVDWYFFQDKFKQTFGRPCPKTPRHGFVESRSLGSEEELREVFKAALASDSEAELLLMPYVNAAYSAVFVPESGVLTIGPGHDGATGGERSIVFPVTVMSVSEAFRVAAGIEGDSQVYLELVQAFESTPTVVQARSGPAIPMGVTEYIPCQAKVELVIEPTKDLLAWEQTCLTYKGLSGIVAWQPGGSLSAHAAIHCRVNNIPYLTRTNKPEVGEVIEPSDVNVSPFSSKEFRCGVEASQSDNPRAQDVGRCLKFAIGILRNAISLEYSPYYSRLIGYAVSWIFRASALACLGEARHFKGDKDSEVYKANRNAVYDRGKSFENSYLCTKLAEFSYKFNEISWGGSYGGWKWYSALVQTVKLWNLISTNNYQQAVSEANILLDMAHNAGWLFNKFIEQEVMNRADDHAGEFLASMIDELYELITANIFSIAPLIPRTERLSKGWKMRIGKNEYYGSNSLVVNDVMWKDYALNSKIMQDTFDNV